MLSRLYVLESTYQSSRHIGVCFTNRIPPNDQKRAHSALNNDAGPYNREDTDHITARACWVSFCGTVAHENTWGLQRRTKDKYVLYISKDSCTRSENGEHGVWARYPQQGHWMDVMRRVL